MPGAGMHGIRRGRISTYRTASREWRARYYFRARGFSGILQGNTSDPPSMRNGVNRFLTFTLRVERRSSSVPPSSVRLPLDPRNDDARQTILRQGLRALPRRFLYRNEAVFQKRRERLVVRILIRLAYHLQ